MATPDELGSILMPVIRSLSAATDSGEQREEQKRQLQVQFKHTDQVVDQLVLRKQKELTKVMQVYARVSNRLAVARNRVSEIKAGLVACKELLHCKRDELKRHWLGGVEQKHILDLLEQIQRLRETPEKFDSMLAQKKFLPASQLLVTALENMNGDLKSVEGLLEMREVLESRKEKLFRLLMDDLARQIYGEVQQDILDYYHANPFFSQRLGSKRKFFTCGPREMSSKESANVMRRTLDVDRCVSDSKNQKGISLISEGELGQLLENPQQAQRDDGVPQRIAIDIECLCLLNKISPALDTLRTDQQSDLQKIVERSTMAFTGLNEGSDSSLLTGLFAAVVDQFVLVADLHVLLSRTLVKSAERNQADPMIKLDRGEIWAKVQTVVQHLLTDYLDFNSKVEIHQPTTAQFTEPTSDINLYFVRRKNVRSAKTVSLFRFEASVTGLSLSDVMKEKEKIRQADDRTQKCDSTQLVCSPNPHNIIPIYNALMDFIGVIEKSLRYEPGNHCTLYSFLMDYIKNVFLGQIHVDNGDALNEASMQLDSWKTITDVEVLREHGLSKPLLTSAVIIRNAIGTMYGYMQTLPLYCEHFVTMMCTILMQYKEICLAAYRGLVQPESEDKRIISTQWAKDDDISRFLRSLPNWQMAHSAAPDHIESVEAIEQRNAKETAILKANLGATQISDHEILCDVGQLKYLAHLQESMSWLSRNTIGLVEKFQQSNTSAIGGLPKLPVNSIQTLQALAKDFEDLSDTCLIVLHLEVRLHCFYHLSSIRFGGAGAQFCGGQDSTDPNADVVKLTTVLSSMEEAFAVALDDAKIKYVFEGVAHLISVILIDSAANIRKINRNGIKKMCRNVFAIQHTLTSNITGSRDFSLELTKQYYEMLNQRPRDILNGIVERGTVFPKEAMVSALELLHRSDINSTSHVLAKNLEKLNDIVNGRIGVTV